MSADSIIESESLARLNSGAREAASIGMPAKDVAYYAVRWPSGIGRGCDNEGVPCGLEGWGGVE